MDKVPAEFNSGEINAASSDEVEREGQALTSEQKNAMKDGGTDRETENKLGIDFEMLFKERNELRNKKILPNLSIAGLFPDNRFSDEEFALGWARVEGRIVRETKAFDELKDIETICRLMRDMNFNLELVEDKSKRMKELKKRGIFRNPRERGSIITWEGDNRQTVFIKGKELLPSSRARWILLALFGELGSEETGALTHEITHYLQGDQGDVEGKILKEIQAHKTGDVVYPKNLSNLELIKQLKDKYGFKNTDVLASSTIEIDKLMALGLNVEMIAKLVAAARWDKESATFPMLEEKIEDLAREKNLDSGDVDNLVLTRRIQRDIEFQKARIIAQEELKKLVEAKGLKID